MGESGRPMQQTNNQQVLLENLRLEQSKTKERSVAWYRYQEQINHIIANRYLEYVNR